MRYIVEYSLASGQYCDSTEAVAELRAPEKSKILRHVARAAKSGPRPADESTPCGLVRRWGGKGPQKVDFAVAHSFATASTQYLKTQVHLL